MTEDNRVRAADLRSFSDPNPRPTWAVSIQLTHRVYRPTELFCLMTFEFKFAVRTAPGQRRSLALW